MSLDNLENSFGSHPTWMELDADALRQNLKEIRQRADKGVMVIASVKANAYGHGIVPVGKVLEAAGVEMLTTGSFADAKAMREAGISTPILMLGSSLPAGMRCLVKENLIPTVYNIASAKAVNDATNYLNTDVKVPVFIKVDCGMGRLGISLKEAIPLIGKIVQLENIWVQGVYTHLSFKDEVSMAFAKKRLPFFYELIAELKSRGYNIPITQALASSALMLGWRDQCSAICPGHLLFGLPSVKSSLADIGKFLPVCASVKSRVIHIADHQTAPVPGSGGYHVNRTQSRTAVAPFGLNDGNRSFLSNNKPVVLYKGIRLSVLGISLEHLTFEIPKGLIIELGDIITIIGNSGNDRIAIEEYSDWLNSTSLETMMSLSQRMPFVLMN